MPFTFSHPAAILPLLQSRFLLSSSGLVMGSIVPDFENLLRMDLKGRIGDTFIGIFVFDLPLSVFLLFVFHGLIRDKCIVSLPNGFSKKCDHFLGFNWAAHFKRKWHIVLISIFIGILTHLLWDSFTHYDGFIALYFYDFFYYKVWGISLFNVFQHLSSLIGALWVCWYIYKMKKGHVPYVHITRKYFYWGTILAVGFLVFLVRSYFGFDRIDEMIVAAIGSIMWGFLLGSVFIKKPSPSFKKKPGRSPFK